MNLLVLVCPTKGLWWKDWNYLKALDNMSEAYENFIAYWWPNPHVYVSSFFKNTLIVPAFLRKNTAMKTWGSFERSSWHSSNYGFQNVPSTRLVVLTIEQTLKSLKNVWIWTLYTLRVYEFKNLQAFKRLSLYKVSLESEWLEYESCLCHLPAEWWCES